MKEVLITFVFRKILLTAALSVYISLSGFAQVLPERFVVYNPLMNENNHASGTEFMNSISVFGEFGHYLQEYESHAWNQKLGVYFEFFRTGDHSSLAFFSNIEFIADPNNDINFNPRAVYWEEAFLFTGRSGNFFWQAGYTHRCKHDVDNLNIGEERSLIYGSILGRLILPVIIREDLKSVAAFRADVYTIRQDYRNPNQDNPVPPSLTDAAATAGINYNLYKYISKDNSGIFLRTSLAANFYSSKNGLIGRFGGINNVYYNWGASAGLFFHGRAGINTGIRYEYQHDTGINIFPLSANLLSLFIAVNNPFDFY